MANLARELTFFIRAENQASRALKSAGKDFGGLAKLKDAQNASAEASAKRILALNDKLARNQDALARNAAQLNRAELALQRTRENAVAAATAGDNKIIESQKAVEAQLAKIDAAEKKLALTRKTMIPHYLGPTIPGKTLSQTQLLMADQEAALASLRDRHVQLQNQLATAEGVPADVVARANKTLAAQAEQIQLVTQNRRKLIGASKDLTSAIEAEDAALTKNTELMSLQKWGVIGAGLQRLGRTARLTGVVVGAAFGFMAKKAADFQTSVTLAATQSTLPGRNTTAQTLANSRYLQDQIIKLQAGGKVTSSMADQTSSAYQIFSSVSLKGNQNQQLKEGIKLLQDFNKSATANYGMVSLNDVVNAGTFLMNRFHVSVEQMPTALNRMQAAVRYGAMNMQQFVKGVGQVGPAFNAAGYSFDQMAASMAFISRKFSANPQMGFTGLARLTETFANPKMLAGLKALGIQAVDANNKLLPLDVIIGNIIKKQPQLVAHGGNVDLQNFFKNTGGLQSTVQSRRAFVSIAQDIAGYRSMIKKVVGDNNELTKSWDAMQQSPQVKWSEFTNKLKALGIAIGVQAIPMIIHLFGWVGNLVKGFNNLSPSSKKLIAELGVFGSVGLVAVGALAGIAGAFLKLYEAIRIMKASGGLRVALGLGGEAGAASLGAILPIAALGALAFILYKYPHLLGDASKAMGGLRGIIIALGIAASGLVLTGLIGRIGLMGGAAVTASAEVSSLRLKLLSLGSIIIPAIVIPVLLKESKSALSSPPGTPHVTVPNKGFFGSALGLWDKVAIGSDILVQKHLFGKTTAQADANINKSKGLSLIGMSVKYTPAPDKILKQLADIGSSPFVNNDLMSQAYAAYKNGDYKQVDKIWKAIVLSPTRGSAREVGGIMTRIFNAATAPNRIMAARRAALAQHATSIVDDKSFITSLQKIAKLQAAYDSLDPNKNGPKAFAAFKKFQAALSALKLQYAAKDYQDYITEYLSKVESADKASVKKRVSAATTAAKAAAKELSNAYSNIMSTYQSFLQQNQSNFGSLFSGPFMQSPGEQARLGINNNAKNIRPDEVFRDLKSQLFQFNTLNSNIKRISKRGGPQSLIDQLRAAGPGALPDIEAINKMSPQMFRQYVATWQRSQKAIKDATLSQLQTQIGVYKKFGSKVALAIIAGIKGEDPKLQNELEAVINKMFPDLVNKAAKAPHKVDSGSKHSLAPVQHQTTHHTTTNLHIHNPKSESVDVATKKAIHMLKTRKR